MQKICTFIGDKNLPIDTKFHNLTSVILYLIIKKDVDTFWFCGASLFNECAYQTVSQLKKEYPHISLVLISPFSILEANNYHAKRYELHHSYDKIIHISHQENTQLIPLKIRHPAEYMLSQIERYATLNTDYLICYNKQDTDSTAFAIKLALSYHKHIINIANHNASAFCTDA